MKDKENIKGGCFLRGIACINILIVFFVMLDFFIAADKPIGKIYDDWYIEVEYTVDHSHDNYGGGSKSSRKYLRSIDNEKFYISDESLLINNLKFQDTFYVERTPIFGKNKSVILQLPEQKLVEANSLFSNTIITLIYLLPAFFSITFLRSESNSLREGILGISTLTILVITGVYIFLY